ncbi:hypothetical protein GGX14DRAFT_577189 [Mycena pura]|uniref:Uncharacterized protein n=1 Tax=Mycena pura TaxID=153505 RepID=A0AAD6Y2J4_9AGAR|nr:hypothetical protein GGX14DRAFT_577189 [Mycena pura]
MLVGACAGSVSTTVAPHYHAQGRFDARCRCCPAPSLVRSRGLDFDARRRRRLAMPRGVALLQGTRCKVYACYGLLTCPPAHPTACPLTRLPAHSPHRLLAHPTTCERSPARSGSACPRRPAHACLTACAPDRQHACSPDCQHARCVLAVGRTSRR